MSQSHTAAGTSQNTHSETASTKLNYMRSRCKAFRLLQFRVERAQARQRTSFMVEGLQLVAALPGCIFTYTEIYMYLLW